MLSTIVAIWYSACRDTHENTGLNFGFAVTNC